MNRVMNARALDSILEPSDYLMAPVILILVVFYFVNQDKQETTSRKCKILQCTLFQFILLLRHACYLFLVINDE